MTWQYFTTQAVVTFMVDQTGNLFLKAMREDYSDIDEEDIFEVAGTKKMFIEGEDGEATEELTTLEEEYEESLGSYCVASENY